MSDARYRIDLKKGCQTIIWIGNDSGSEGIDITINKRRRTLRISGWFDSIVGIQGAEIPLDEIVALFGKRQKEQN